jgi:hypothetical protein
MTRVERFKRERPGDYAGITLALAAGDDRAAIAERFRVTGQTVYRVAMMEGYAKRMGVAARKGCRG